MPRSELERAKLIEALESAAVKLWAVGQHGEARKIERLLNGVSPDSYERIGAMLKSEPIP
jgi:hypothetical protein